MRLLFAGTPDVALPSLRALADSRHEIVAVLTRPDARKGRGRSLHPSPVAAWARERDIPTLTPRGLRSPEVQQEIADLGVDAAPVVAYGALIPPALLDGKALRVPAKWFIRKVAERLTNSRIPDLNSGLRAFRREVSLPYLRLLPPGFSCVTTITIATLKSGDMFGEMGLVTDNPAVAGCVMTTSGHLLHLPRADFHALARRFPAVARYTSQLADARRQEQVLSADDLAEVD